MNILERVKVYLVEVGVLRRIFLRVNILRNSLAVLKQLTGFQIGRDSDVDVFSALRYFSLRLRSLFEAGGR